MGRAPLSLSTLVERAGFGSRRISEDNELYLDDDLPYLGRIKTFGGPIKGYALSTTFFPYMLSAQMEFDLPDFNCFPYYRAIGSERSERLALEKFSQKELLLNDRLERIRSLTEEWIVHQLRPFISPELTPLQEVVKYCDFTTNPGVPWNYYHRTKMSCFLDPKFRDEFLPIYWERLSSSEPIISFTKEFMKSENRKVSKLLYDDQRIIAGTALEHVLCGNIFELSFNKQLYACALLSFSCAGMSLMHHGMNSIVLKLDRFPNCWELDAYRHEMTFQRWGHDSVHRIKKSFMRLPHELTLKWDEISRQKYSGPLVLSDGSVYWLRHCQKSGQFSTLPDNTLHTEHRFEMCFVDLFMRQYSREPHIADYLDNVVTCVVGDDLNFSVSNSFVGWFNFRTISKWFREELGLIQKTDFEEPRRASQLSFLSHHSELTPFGCYEPQLEFDKLVTSLFFGGQGFNLWDDLERMAGLRIVGWTNVRFRRLTDWLLYQMRDKLAFWKGTPELAKFQSEWKTDREIFQLFHPHA
jgi:hypothetical protein